MVMHIRGGPKGIYMHYQGISFEDDATRKSTSEWRKMHFATRAMKEYM